MYVAKNARFALTEVTLGIMPGAGGTQNLARAVGERRAKELILSGLPFTAVEAEAWGLVNRVVEPSDLLESTIGIARRIAANGPIAVRQAKQAIHRGMQMSLWDGLAFEIEAYNRLVPTEDPGRGTGVQRTPKAKIPGTLSCDAPRLFEASNSRQPGQFEWFAQPNTCERFFR